MKSPTDGSMNADAAAGAPCFLVEWYRPDFLPESIQCAAAQLNTCAEALTSEGSAVRLGTMLAVPADEVMFAVFTSSSAHVVAEVCRRAGLPAGRLTAAAQIGGQLTERSA
jgi:hypothetical protein